MSAQIGGNFLADVRMLAVPFAMLVSLAAYKEKKTPKAPKKKSSKRSTKPKARKQSGGCGCSDAAPPVHVGGNISSMADAIRNHVNDLML